MSKNKSVPHNSLVDYSREFAFFEIYNQRACRIAAAFDERTCFEVFAEQFNTIDAAYEGYGSESQEYSAEELHNLFSTVLPCVSFGNVAASIHEKADKIAHIFLSGYQEDLDAIFKGKDFERLSDSYQLSSDFMAEQQKLIASGIAEKFNAVILTIREFERKREWLLTRYEEFKTQTNDDPSWVTHARIFGGGSLATDNPILVSPQRVPNRRTQFVENNQHQDFIDSYLQIWNEFELMFDPLRQEIIEATNNANEYISTISNEIYFQGVRKILIETAEAGHSIDHFFKWVKKEYESFAVDEKNLGIEEWGRHEQNRNAQHH
jgi:hypothetical protein